MSSRMHDDEVAGWRCDRLEIFSQTSNQCTGVFFLHDGRTNDLMVAIQDHFSRRFSDGGDNPGKDLRSYTFAPSEANAVVERFNTLSEEDKQAILDFLRSL